jgi:hypothetical protein
VTFPKLLSCSPSQFAFTASPYFIRRSRIELLQHEVSDLNSKLIAAASRGDDSAAEWAPYFQAAQRDHAQKLQVCDTAFFPVLVVRLLRQELNATHAADLRLLQEAKERERLLWEREIDAALAHVKVALPVYETGSQSCGRMAYL